MQTSFIARTAPVSRPVSAVGRMSFSRIAALLPKAVSKTASLSSSKFLGGSLQSSTRQISTSFIVNADRLNGQVKWFDPVKGFGFIIPADGTQDLFVHQTSIIANGFRSLADGEDVEYELGEDPSGRTRAVNVSGPSGEPVKGTPRPPPRDDFGRGGGRGGGGDFGGQY